MQEARQMTLLEFVKELENLPQDDAHEIWCIPFYKYGFRLEAKPILIERDTPNLMSVILWEVFELLH